MKDSTRLAFAYPINAPLKERGYMGASFRGRRLLTLLRIDDLPLRAASWLAFSAGPKTCWCGEHDETREHFLLSCPALRDIRESHMKYIRPLQGGVCLPTAMTYLLLGSEPEAEDDIQRAEIVGAFVADLWLNRGKRSGIHQESFSP